MIYVEMLNRFHKKISMKNETVLKILILILSIFYSYLAILPKHSDFWNLNFAAKFFAQNNLDIYGAFSGNSAATVAVMHPPAFYILQGAWIKLGSYIFNYDLTMWNDPLSYPYFYPFWGMIPYLIALFTLVIIAYFTLKNKWLCLICYGTFAFVSVIIMGQTDIFCALFIFISLLLALKWFEKKNSIIYIFLSVITLGLSMTFKFYGGLLIPIYILFSFLIFKLKMKSAYEVYGVITGLIFVFIFSFMFIWIPFAKWFGNMAFGGESSWLFNLQINPVALPPYHNISIWLLGFLIILYDLVSNIVNKPHVLYNDKKYFIFYSFVSISWFFVSVYTHPQWWMIIVPPILLVLDNFRNRFNYFFTFSTIALFWFYPMMFVNNIDKVLNYYIPVVPIEGNLATLLSTSLVAVLITWMIELRKELSEDTSQRAPSACIFSKFDLTIPVVAIFAFVIMLMILFIPNIVSQDSANQPIGEIMGNTTIGQTFFAPYANLNAIDIDFATYARVNTKDLVFHLRTSPSSPTDIFSSKINAQNIDDNKFYRFTFPKIRDSKDKSYYFFVEAPEAASGNAITIWSNYDDVYKGGSAYKDGQPIRGDLTFKTSYSRI
jgi:hypothetical protein